MATPEANLRRRVLASLKKQCEDSITHIEYWSNAMAYSSGLPDLSVLAYGMYFAVELKAPNGKLSQLQKNRLTGIARSGNLAGVLRPHPSNKRYFLWEEMQTDGQLRPPIDLMGLWLAQLSNTRPQVRY